MSMQTYLDTQSRRLLIGVLAVLALAFFTLLSLHQYSALFALGWAMVFLIFLMFPAVGLYATILGLPLINWNFYIKGLIIPASDLLGITLLAAFATRRIFYALFAPDRKKADRLRLPFFVPFLLFFTAALISSLISTEPLAASWAVLRWIGLAYAAFVVVPVNVITDEKKLKTALFTFIISAAAVALMGIASLFFQDWQETFIRIRPIELFNRFPIGDNQNLIAEFLVIGVFFALALKFLTVSETNRRLLNILALVLGAVSLLTFSRAAWLSLVFGIGVYIIYRARHTKNSYLPLIIIALLVIAPISVYMAKLQSEFSIGVSSTENRLLLSEIAWTALSNRPVFGYGTNSFYGLVENNIRFRAQYGDPLDSHGVLQKIMAENGIVGLFSFSVFLIAIFGALAASIRHVDGRIDIAGRYAYIIPLYIGSAVGFFFQFFNTSYFKGKVWLPIGMAIAGWYIIEAAKKRKPRSS